MPYTPGAAMFMWSTAPQKRSPPLEFPAGGWRTACSTAYEAGRDAAERETVGAKDAGYKSDMEWSVE